MTRDSLVSQELQVARPPEVLERSLPIQEEYVQLACRRFRLCGVNLDKNVRRHHMHSDRVTESLHYFYSYGVLNRIDFSARSDVRMLHKVFKDICGKMAEYQADNMDQCKDYKGDRQPKSTISSSQDDRCCNTCPIQQESGAFEPSLIQCPI